MNKSCKRYLSGLHNDDLWNLTLNAIDELVRCGILFYRQDDVDVDEGIFWEATGESLIEEFKDNG